MGGGNGEDIHLLWENMHSGPDLGLIETQGKKEGSVLCLGITPGFLQAHYRISYQFNFIFQTLCRASHSLSKHPCEHVSKITPAV